MLKINKIETLILYLLGLGIEVAILLSIKPSSNENLGIGLLILTYLFAAGLSQLIVKQQKISIKPNEEKGEEIKNL